MSPTITATRCAMSVLIALVLIGVLTACSGSTSSGLTESGPITRPGAGGTLVQQVRAAGQIGNELDVQPLRDPQVEDLRTTARAAEQRGDYAAAQRAISAALVLTPEDPDLLQWQAELALASRDWNHAEQMATQSYDKGPKLGGLCRRNWMTILFSARARGNGKLAAQAQQRVSACTVAPPVRM